MAGMPRRRAMVGELERRAKKNDQSVLEYAVEWLENGKTLVQLAESITKSLEEEEGYVSRSMVSRYLNNELGAQEELEAARREGSHGMAEGAITVIDEPVDSKEDVTRNKNRAEMRLKLAGFLNPQYRDQRGTNVNVNVNNGQLHLDALRQRAVPARVVQPALEDGGPDVEVVGD